MGKIMTKTTLTAFIVCIALGIMFWGSINTVETASRKHTAPIVEPDIFGPITTVDNEVIRVNVFNDDPALDVEYVVQFIDLFSGAVVEEIYTGRIFPMEGTNVDFLPPYSSMPTLVIIHAQADPDGYGVYEDCPINISSVEVTTEIPRGVRVIPEIH